MPKRLSGREYRCDGVCRTSETENRIPEMQEVLAKVMGVEADDVSIKATTTEKLGFTGREEGISAYATVLIEKIEKGEER